MLKGGVIMDVVTAEHAKIAQDAGACAVMMPWSGCPRTSAKRAVARMSDPALIRSIREAVTIPVMAKCRIGHFDRGPDRLGGAGDRLHRRVRSADPGRRGVPHRPSTRSRCPSSAAVGTSVKALRRMASQEGAAMIRTKRRGGHGQRRRGRSPPRAPSMARAFASCRRRGTGSSWSTRPS